MHIDLISTLLISHIFTKVCYVVYRNRDLTLGNTFAEFEETDMNCLVAMATKTFWKQIFLDSVNLVILSTGVTNIVPISIKFMSNEHFNRMDQNTFLKIGKLAFGYHGNHVFMQNLLNFHILTSSKLFPFHTF